MSQSIELDLFTPFYNTTCLSDSDLKEHRFRAGHLNRKILDFFKSHSYENYTCWEVNRALGINSYPITSIRRSMSDLTPDYLVKLDGKEGHPFVQRKGFYKEACYCWTAR